MKEQIRLNSQTYKILQDAIIYLFQYGFITEKKHFKMIDELNTKYTT